MSKRIVSGILAVSLLVPISALASNTLTLTDEVSNTSIGTVSNITRDCALNSNNGRSVVVTCDANMFSNDITFPVKNKNGDNIAFISASNPLFGSAKFELRDPKNNQVISTCYADGECKVTDAVDVRNTAGDYLIAKKIGGSKVILIKNIDQ